MPKARSTCLILLVSVQSISVSQEEYLEALNKQEIVKKELDGAKHTLDLVTNETNTLRKDAAQITELYRQQDELLGECREENISLILFYFTDSRPQQYMSGQSIAFL